MDNLHERAGQLRGDDGGESDPRTVSPKTVDLERFSIDRIQDVLWTLTQRCNLHCTYCGVRSRGGSRPYEPTRSEVDRILEQLAELHLESLVLSGGEALLSPHIGYVLERTASIAPVRYLITNGTTARPRERDLLATFRPRTMVSIDSLDESTNAKTRGDKRLAAARETVEWLLQEGIFTIVIMVLTRHNAGRVHRTIEGLYALGVRNILIQQLHCTTAKLADSYLEALPDPGDVRRLYIWLQQFAADHPDVNIDDNEVCFFEHRPGEYARKCLPDTRYLPQRLFMCGAGFSFFALKANGDVIPCNAFLDVVVGNVHDADIQSILENAPTMQGLRSLRCHRVDEVPGCADCAANPVCDGGCRADVFNLTGEIGNPHPCCARVSTFYANARLAV